MNRRKALQLGLAGLAGILTGTVACNKRTEPNAIKISKRLERSIVVIDEASTGRVFKNRCNSRDYRTDCQTLCSELGFDYCASTPEYIGTGTVINAEEGIILTAAHCISRTDNQNVIGIVGSSDPFLANVIAYREDLDLAILQTRDLSRYGIFSLPIAKRSVGIGSPIYVIGMANAKRIRDVVTQPGKLSSGSVSIFGPLYLERDVINITASINPGDSGGPIVNSSLELVGIMTNHGPYSSYGTSLQGIHQILRDIA